MTTRYRRTLTDTCENCGHRRRAHNRDRGACQALIGSYYCTCSHFKFKLPGAGEIARLRQIVKGDE